MFFAQNGCLTIITLLRGPKIIIWRHVLSQVHHPFEKTNTERRNFTDVIVCGVFWSDCGFSPSTRRQALSCLCLWFLFTSCPWPVRRDTFCEPAVLSPGIWDPGTISPGHDQGLVSPSWWRPLVIVIRVFPHSDQWPRPLFINLFTSLAALRHWQAAWKLKNLRPQPLSNIFF